jgi:hypothetical protein
MTDFRVEPARALLGLVRARDEVVVEYSVAIAAPDEAAAPTAAARGSDGS